MGLEASTPICTPKSLPGAPELALVYQTQANNWIHSQGKDANCKANEQDKSLLHPEDTNSSAVNACIRYKQRQGTFPHGFNQR